ncbi:hypothetical protein JS531_09225 [Bifidobacterium sp. CP2]|uniref:hypothetical protein n=1 Tax=Bifidobacterium sp. CP2 TaxID=2809025 RepID=UPI001BDC5D76|nr:hypothetical protein [Bifidobacterium sp. CP2]MBT1182122.1 hypothetical protein [Bifidobacterium sp. CP2]
MFDVEPTKVMEFSLLFSGQETADVRDFEGERRLLRDGRDVYECGRLRAVTERPTSDGRGVIVEADVMDKMNEKVRAHVTVRVAGASTRTAVRRAGRRPAADDDAEHDVAGMETITGMACTCTRRGAPRCVHACAVCFRLFYRHRYTVRDVYANRPVVPHEASRIVERYMADRLGTWFPHGTDDTAVAMARGLEIITGFDQWDRWIGNRHTVTLLGNCIPAVEELIDMDTQVWPKRDEPDLTAVLPHGWFTMLEAAYEQLGDRADLAKVYAVYIAQGRLPQDARYVDRLRWLLGDTTELDVMLGQLTGGFRPANDERMRPVAGLAYEHLLREFRLSDEAVSYCESLRKYDRRCVRRLADTIAIGHADRVEDLKAVKIDWTTCFDEVDIDFAGEEFRADLEDNMPAFFANGYVDPIIEDCEALLRAAAAGSRARCRLVVSRWLSTEERATIARDLLRRDEGRRDSDDKRSIILQRAISMVEPHADPLARTFLVDDDVVVFTPPLDEATLQTENPHDFMEALLLVDDIDGLPLVHDEASGGEQDLAIVEHAVKARIEKAKTEARFDDIVSAVTDDQDRDGTQSEAMKGLRECLDVQLQALFGTRFSLDSTACDDLFDPPVTLGQRNKWLRPTAGQLGVWTAAYVLNVKRHEHGDLVESVHLPHYLAAKGLKTAMIGMLDHMLGTSAMLGIPRAQVDTDEWQALRLLLIDLHPEAVDAHGSVAMLRPDRDFTVPYLTQILRHMHPGLSLIDAGDECAIQGAMEELRMRLSMVERHVDGDPDYLAEYARKEADDIALALALAALANPEGVPPLIDDADVARAAAEQAKRTYMTFWNARDENDATPADDDDEIAGHEGDITDAGNMMLMLLEQTYTRLMDVAEPGYKDW